MRNNIIEPRLAQSFESLDTINAELFGEFRDEKLDGDIVINVLIDFAYQFNNNVNKKGFSLKTDFEDFVKHICEEILTSHN